MSDLIVFEVNTIDVHLSINDVLLAKDLTNKAGGIEMKFVFSSWNGLVERLKERMEIRKRVKNLRGLNPEDYNLRGISEGGSTVFFKPVVDCIFNGKEYTNTQYLPLCAFQGGYSGLMKIKETKEAYVINTEFRRDDFMVAEVWEVPYSDEDYSFEHLHEIMRTKLPVDGWLL